jgi:hypothetical protein
MSLLYCDSFDHYDTAAIRAKWDILSGLGAAIDPAVGRTGQSLRLIGSATNVSKQVGISNVLILGLAVRLTDHGPGALFCFFQRFGTPGPEVTITVSATGTLEARLGSATGTILGTTAAAIPINEWHYVECRVLFDPFNGQVEILIDSSSSLALTGVQTSATFATSATDLILNGTALTGSTQGRALTWWADDLYVLDDQGGINDGFLFSPQVVAMLPSGAGDFSMWTPHGSTPNWRCVNGSAAGDWSTYVAASTPGAIDLYTVPNPGFGTVHAVQLCVESRWTGPSGGHAVQAVVQSGGNQYPGRETLVLFDRYSTTPWDVDPDTSSPWTGYTVAGAQWGQQID